jgi:hypothetical protein
MMNMNGIIDKGMQTGAPNNGTTKFGNILEPGKGRLAELARYKKMYEDYRPRIDNALAIEQWLRYMSGIGIMANHTFVMIPMGPRMDLSAVRIRTFKESKNPFFSNHNIIDFLHEKDVRTVVGIVASPESVRDYDQITLSAMAMPINPVLGRILAGIARSHGTALKFNEIKGSTGWIAYAPEDSKPI